METGKIAAGTSFYIRELEKAKGRIAEFEKRLAEAEAKLTETEKALRWACNTYIVDDYYTGDLRNERLERAVRRVMVKVTGRV